MNKYHVEKSDLKGFFKVVCTYTKGKEKLVYTYTELTSENEANEKADFLNGGFENE